MSAPNPFQNLPPISFANTDVVALTNAIVQAFQIANNAQTGENLTLGPADRRYHFLLSLTAWFVSAFEQLDLACKNNLLAFATGGFLDQLAALYGPRALRLQATGATTTLQFTLAEASGTISDIPAGTQVQSTDATGYVFATNVDLQIPAGQFVGSVDATCISDDPNTGNVAGLSANNIPVGAISTLVNWTGNFVVSATNLTVTSDGIDTETDSAYAARLYGSLGSYGGVDDSFSNQVGSYGAYDYLSESVPGVSQVSVAGPEDGLAPGNVLLTVLGPNGTSPSSALLTAVYDAVTPENIRPLTDYVTVAAPTGVPFSVSVSYYVPESFSNNLVNIQTNVTGAVNTFISDVTTTLSARIDPSVLSSSMVDQGAIRVTVVEPSYLSLTKMQQAVLVGDPVISYEGMS